MFIKGHSIDLSVVSLMNVLETAKEWKSDIYLSSWDITKAIDRVPIQAQIWAYVRLGLRPAGRTAAGSGVHGGTGCGLQSGGQNSPGLPILEAWSVRVPGTPREVPLHRDGLMKHLGVRWDMSKDLFLFFYIWF